MGISYCAFLFNARYFFHINRSYFFRNSISCEIKGGTSNFFSSLRFLLFRLCGINRSPTKPNSYKNKNYIVRGQARLCDQLSHVLI